MRPHRRNGKAAFTLIELLVVIGILLVLVGLAVIGYNVLDRAVAGRSTRTTLENLRALTDEADAGAGLSTLNLPINGNLPVNAADVSTSTSPDRYGTAVQQTSAAIAALQRFPKNKQAIAQFPNKIILRAADNSPYAPNGGPVLLDAWGNPIIFVPGGAAGGLIVNLTVSAGPSGGQPQTVQKTIQAPYFRPFWASAGQDGDFSKGDDNLYSFQAQ